MRNKYLNNILCFVFIIAMLCSTALPVSASKSPTLQVQATEIPEGEAGRFVQIPITLHNDSYYIAKKIVVTPIIDKEIPLSIEELNIKKTIEMITPRKTAEPLMFKFKVNSNAKIGTYPIRFKITYKDTDNQSREMEETLYLKITKEHLPVEVIVDKVSNSKKQLSAGDDFTMSITLANKGTTSAKNVIASLESNDKIVVTDNASEKYLTEINGALSKVITYTLKVKEDIEGGNYPLTFKMKYQNELNATVEKTAPIYVKVAGAADKEKADLSVSNIEISEEVNTEENFTISFDLTNNGGGKAKDVEVVVEPEEGKIIPITLSKKLLSNLESGATQPLSFTFKGGKDLKSQNYPLKITIKYRETDSKDSEQIVLEQYAGIYINSKASLTGSTPIMIVKNYASEPQMVNAGESFKLNLDFWNTSDEKEVRNMKITLTVKESSENSNDDVFTPVDGSMTFYVKSIGADSVAKRDVTLFTVPDAKAKNYKIQVNFEYEFNKNGEVVSGTSTDVIGIPVVQPSRLEFSSINSAVEFPVERGGDLSLDFFNTGKVRLINLMIKLEMDNPEDARVENGTYYVGNFEVGNSDFYEARIVPLSEGEKSGKILFTYEDPTGKQQVLEQPFVIEATPAVSREEEMMEGGPNLEGMENMEQEKGSKLWMWIGGGAVLLIAIIIIIVVVRRKKKKGMILDEDF